MTQWIKAILSGIGAASQAVRLSIGLYVFTLVFGLVIAWPVRSFLLQHSANSSALDSLVERTSYTFINDFRIAYGDGWLPDFGQLLILAVLYLLIWTFLTGGIIQRLRTDSVGVDFWAACGQHFRTLLTLNGLFLILQIVLVLIFCLFYYSINSGFSSARLDTETTIVASFPWVWGSYLILASWILLWQSLSQIVHVRDEVNAWYLSIREGFSLFRQRFVSYALFGLAALAVLVLTYLLFHTLKQAIPMGKMKGGVWLLLLLTQCWLWGRIFLKLCFMGTLLRFSVTPKY